MNIGKFFKKAFFGALLISISGFAMAMEPTQETPKDDYQIRINCHGSEQEFKLSPEFTKRIPNKIDLDSIYLDRHFLKDTKEIRKYLDEHELQREIIEIQTEDGYCVYGELFDRGSDVLLVVGQGFQSHREYYVPDLALFPECDILLIDYVGNGLNHIPQTKIASFSYKYYVVDMCATRLGSTDEVDVINLVKTVKQRKVYTHCYGHAFCHSVPIFVKAAITEPTLFEKLIIDGCWSSIEQVIKKVARDFTCLCSKDLAAKSHCKFITYREWFQNGLCHLIEKLSGVNLSRIEPLETHLSRLTIPVLFFQSSVDDFCSMDQFEIIWQSIRSDKVAVITPHFHCRTHVYEPKIYEALASAFLLNTNMDDIL